MQFTYTQNFASAYRTKCQFLSSNSLSTITLTVHKRRSMHGTERLWRGSCGHGGLRLQYGSGVISTSITSGTISMTILTVRSNQVSHSLHTSLPEYSS